MDNNNTNGTDTKKANSRLMVAIIAALALGVLAGGFFPVFGEKLSLLGTVFLNLLMMIVVPLVVFSIISGITGLGTASKIGGLGRRTILYYLITTTISVILGIILVNIIEPGAGFAHGERYENMAYELAGDNNRSIVLSEPGLTRWNYTGRYRVRLLDRDIEGPIASMEKTRITVSSWTGDVQALAGTRRGRGLAIEMPLAARVSAKKDRDVSSTLKEVLVGDEGSGREGLVPRNIFNAMARMDVLPLIFFSILFALALTAIGDRGRAAADVISSANEAIHRMVDWIMMVSPLGIFGIIAGRVGKAGGFEGFLPELVLMGKYVVTVIIGLSLHAFVVLPVILMVVGRRNPFQFLSGMGAALLNAFSTASSSATLPISMDVIEKNNGISRRISGFVLPIGATINMDGTALYEAVAAIFIAQAYGIDLSLASEAVIVITATLAAIGAAGIPEAGLVTMVIVLKAVGLPVDGIGLILAIDWFLDRCRTTVNVWGDCVGAGVIETLEDRAGSKLIS